MEAIEMFGPKLAALFALVALAYVLLSFAPVLWPAMVVRRVRPALPRRLLFVVVVAALVYGVFSFIAFAILLPIEVYGIYIAPQLEEAGIANGSALLQISGFLADNWWILVPPTQLILTWYVTKIVKARWAYICAAPPNPSFKPTSLRDAA
jgi:hypothetical protein